MKCTSAEALEGVSEYFLVSFLAVSGRCSAPVSLFCQASYWGSGIKQNKTNIVQIPCVCVWFVKLAFQGSFWPFLDVIFCTHANTHT